MKLQGFRCDGCGIESREKKGRWTEVTSLAITADGWMSFLQSEGLHYCSPDCLRDAMETKWEKSQRPTVRKPAAP